MVGREIPFQGERSASRLCVLSQFEKGGRDDFSPRIPGSCVQLVGLNRHQTHSVTLNGFPSQVSAQNSTVNKYARLKAGPIGEALQLRHS
jgi:hypothetical protein